MEDRKINRELKPSDGIQKSGKSITVNNASLFSRPDFNSNIKRVFKLNEKVV